MNNYILTGLFLLSSFFTFAQSVQVGETERGMASFYNDKFHGSRTAYEEIYNKNVLTAAHKKWPKGTIVKVTRIDNNKSVIVRINDKGPYVKGFVIDLSRKAAEDIDMVRDGSASVKIEVVQTADGMTKSYNEGSTPKIDVNDPKISPYGVYKIGSQKVATKGQYGVQVGVYSDSKNIPKQVSILQSKGFVNVVVSIEKDKNGEDKYRLLTGPYPKLESATASKVKLRKSGFSSCFVVDLDNME
jgi:rare lipoprotein A